MASASIQAFRRTVTVAWPQHAKEEAQKTLVRVARAGHAAIMVEQQARAGFVPEFDAYANTPGNTNLDSVRLPGPIVYRYRYLREVLTVAMDELRKASPIVSGLYRDSHTLYINGIAVTGAAPNLKAGDELFIANPVPYSRRLEVGKTESGRDFVVQVPNHIYERVMKRVLVPRYRNVAKFTFDYVTIPGAYIVRGRLPSHYIAKGGIRRKRRQQVGKPVRAPAIVISVPT